MLRATFLLIALVAACVVLVRLMRFALMSPYYFDRFRPDQPPLVEKRAQPKSGRSTSTCCGFLHDKAGCPVTRVPHDDATHCPPLDPAWPSWQRQHGAPVA